MLDFFYAGFDGHKHHGSIGDRILMESTYEKLWEEVVEYVKEKHDGKAQVEVVHLAREIHTIDV